jgi:hypothetical protein
MARTAPHGRNDRPSALLPISPVLSAIYIADINEAVES